MATATKTIIFISVITLLLALEFREVSGACASVPSCVSCPTAGTCEQCNPLNGIDANGKCQSCRNQVGGKCFNCTEMTACLQCDTGFAPTPGGPGCTACPTGCQTCATSGPSKCDQCSQGFRNTTAPPADCEACTDANCAQCPAAAGTCQNCKTGYSLIGGSCVQCAANCRSCLVNGAGKCDSGQCLSKFGLNPTTMQCDACVSANCSVCENPDPSSTQCTTCLPKFTLQADNTCKYFCTQIPNCDDCFANPTRCVQCREPFGVNVTTHQCSNCTTLTGCSRCDNTSLCTRCMNQDTDGPMLDGSGTCAPCATNCLRCNVSGAGKCNVCKDGFRVAADGTCEACTVSQCAKCPVAAGTCSSCLPGFVLDAGTCKACAPNCNFCGANGAGNCDPLYCKAGFTFNTATKQCDAPPTTTAAPVTTPPPCTTIPHCLVCSDPNTCDKCDTEQGYGVTTSGMCELCSTNTGCSRCDNLTLCTQCTNFDTQGPLKDGSGACADCAANCLQCPNNGAGKCDTCQATFALNAGMTCDPCTVTNCATCTNTPTATCSACVDRYVLKAGACEPCGAHCTFCGLNGAGKCDPTKCEAGFPYQAATKTCLDTSATTVGAQTTGPATTGGPQTTGPTGPATTGGPQTTGPTGPATTGDPQTTGPTGPATTGGPQTTGPTGPATTGGTQTTLTDETTTMATGGTETMMSTGPMMTGTGTIMTGGSGTPYWTTTGGSAAWTTTGGSGTPVLTTTGGSASPVWTTTATGPVTTGPVEITTGAPVSTTGAPVPTSSSPAPPSEGPSSSSPPVVGPTTVVGSATTTVVAPPTTTGVLIITTGNGSTGSSTNLGLILGIAIPCGLAALGALLCCCFCLPGGAPTVSFGNFGGGMPIFGGGVPIRTTVARPKVITRVVRERPIIVREPPTRFHQGAITGGFRAGPGFFP